MADLASLGIQVDSSQAQTASQRLGDFTTAAGKAEASTTQLSSASQQLVKALRDKVSQLQSAKQAYDAQNAPVQKLIDNMEQLNEALDKQSSAWKAANDNVKSSGWSFSSAADNVTKTSQSFLKTSIELIKIAGYLQLLAKVAYSASPIFAKLSDSISGKASSIAATAAAFTGLGPAIGKAHSSLEPFVKVAAGAEMISMASHINLATLAAAAMVPPLRQVASKEIWDGVKAVPVVLTRALSPLSGFIGGIAGSMARVLGPIAVLVGAFELLRAAVHLGAKQIEDFHSLLDKLGEETIGFRLFVGLKKQFEEAGNSMEDLTRELKKFYEASEPSLEGSPLNKRLDELIDAGNFKKNAGVKMFEEATSPEERLRALAKLFDEAIDKRERLAALDLAKTAFGPDSEIVKGLKLSGDYLQEMIDKADALKNKELINPDDLARAEELHDRLDEANKQIAKLKEPMPGLVALGIDLQGAWVRIVEAEAKAAGWLINIINFFADLKKAAQDFGNLPIWDKINDFLSRWGLLGKLPIGLAGGLQGLPVVKPGQEEDKANFKERWYSLPGAQDIIDRQNAEKVRDISKPTQVAAAAGEYDRLYKSIQRNITAMEADAKTVGLGAEAHEYMRVKLRLEEAAMQDGTKITAARADAIEKLAKRAGEAALVLEKAKVAADIKFDRQTAFLTDDDVQIAQKLRNLYPEVSDAMVSVQAAGMRMNIIMRDVGQAISNNLSTAIMDFVSGAKTGQEAFRAFGLAVVKALEEMVIKMLIVAPLMRSLQALMGGFGGGGGGGFLGMLFGGLKFAEGAALYNGRVTAFAGGGVFGGPTLFPMAGGMGLAGEAGPEAVMPLKRGPGGRLGIEAQGSTAPPVNITMNNDFRGASPEAVAAIGLQLIELKKTVRQMPQIIAASQVTRPSLRR